MRSTRSIFCLFTVAVLALTLGTPSRARIPEPDFTYYGSASNDGTPIFTGTIAVLPQKVCADDPGLACGSDPDCLNLGRTGPCNVVGCTGAELVASTLASYAIPSNPPPDYKYILRIPVDSVDPRQPGHARPGDGVLFCLDRTDYLAVPVQEDIVSIGGTLAAAGPDWDRVGLDPESDGSFVARGLARNLDLDTSFESGTSSRLYVRDAGPVFEDPLGEAATADFLIEVIPPSADSVVLQCATQDGTNTGAADFTFPAQCNDDVTIAPGGSVVINVPLVGDTDVEEDETFLLNVLDAALVVGGDYVPIPIADGEGQATILDDDGEPTVVVDEVEAVESVGNAGDCGGAPSPCLRFTATLSRPVTPGTGSFTFGTAADPVGANPADAVDDYSDLCEAGGCIVEVLDCATDPDCPGGGQDGLRAEGFVGLQDDLLDEVSRETFLVEVFDATVTQVATGRMSIVDDELFLRWAEREADELDNSGAPCVPGVDIGCPDGLEATLDVVLDSQGKHLYAAGSTADSVAIFERDRDSDPEPGKLFFKEAVQDETGQGFVHGIRGARALTMSSNNRYLYVAGSVSNAVAVFNRNTFTGDLSFVEALTEGDLRGGGLTLTGLIGAADVVLSPETDNPHLYTAATGSSAIMAFSRDSFSGELTPACDAPGAPATCTDLYADGEGGLDLLGGVSALAVSPDGAHVYAASPDDGAVTVLSRDPATGLLTLVEAVTSPVELNGALGLVVSPDGEHLYVAGQGAGAIVAFSRDTLSAPPDFGKLTHLQTLQQGDPDLAGLGGIAALAMDADGELLYGAGFLDDSLVVLIRDDSSGSPTFGELTFLEDQQNGNLDPTGQPDPGWTSPGIARPSAVAVSPVSGGNHVYVAGSEDNAVAVFRRVYAPPLNPTTTENADWSSSHDPGVPIAATLLQFEWAGALLDTSPDPDQTLAGYSVLIDQLAGTEVDDAMEVSHVAGTAVACVDVSPCGTGEVCEAGFCRYEHSFAQELTIGNQWYLHIRTCDNSGNCSPTVHAGPYSVGASFDGDPIPDGSGVACVTSDDCSPGEDCVSGFCQYDNCPGLDNPDQIDEDLDLIGDACDPCVDRDGDGYGSPGAPGCPGGGDIDCNDQFTDIYPGAPEGCNGIDNDCDSALPPSEQDLDLDGFRVCENDCTDNLEDTDGDGILDGFQDNPASPERCDGRDNNCDGSLLVDEIDTDGDSFINCPGLPIPADNCPSDYNPGQEDLDGDAAGDLCDNCSRIANADQADVDLDTIGDLCDNCPAHWNLSQDDLDADRVGDPCDNCPSLHNASQSDLDADLQGDRCDLDDGLIYIDFIQSDRVDWQTEEGHLAWDWYKGDMFILRFTGVYTQLPGSNSLAAQECSHGDSWFADSDSPAPGAAAFYLVAGAGEIDLGTDSTGAARTNTNPCP